MKRNIWQAVIRFFLFSPLFLLAGCMKDKVTRTYTVSTPVFEPLSKFREQIKSMPATAIVSPGKITVTGHYILLSEPDKGIHVIDNSNPADPKNVSFINIPGNMDLAVRGNMMYADSYADLITFDMTDPLHAIPANFETYVLPDRNIYYFGNYMPSGGYDPDSVSVIIGYTKKDTTVDYVADNYPVYFGYCSSCAVSPSAASGNITASPGNTIGTNGSMARFCIVNNFLYTAGMNVTSFDISQPSKPVMTTTVWVGMNAETIYPLKDKLFVGTNNGMFMYDILSTPSKPSLIGEFVHVRACDPVIADDNYAYVTLNDSSACLGFNNQLQIVDIKDLSNSFMVKAYQLTHPMGLSKDGNLLFVCDNRDGLKVYDATDVSNLALIKQLKGCVAYDVIAEKGLAVVLARDGIYQYDYSDPENIHLISKL